MILDRAKNTAHTAAKNLQNEKIMVNEANDVTIAELDAFTQRHPDNYVDTDCDPFIPEIFGKCYGVYNPREATTEYVMTKLCVSLFLELVSLLFLFLLF